MTVHSWISVFILQLKRKRRIQCRGTHQGPRNPTLLVTSLGCRNQTPRRHHGHVGRQGATGCQGNGRSITKTTSRGQSLLRRMHATNIISSRTARKRFLRESALQVQNYQNKADEVSQTLPTTTSRTK
jgi:hypothetical protein